MKTDAIRLAEIKTAALETVMNRHSITIDQVEHRYDDDGETFYFNGDPLLRINHHGDSVEVIEMNDAAKTMYKACSKARGIVSKLQRKKTYNPDRYPHHRDPSEHLGAITSRQNKLRPMVS